MISTKERLEKISDDAWLSAEQAAYERLSPGERYTVDMCEPGYREIRARLSDEADRDPAYLRAEAAAEAEPRTR